MIRYLKGAHDRLTQILDTTFEPLNSYVEGLVQRFRIVYDPATRSEVIDYVAEDHDFEDCCEKVEDFNRIVREINGMV